MVPLARSLAEAGHVVGVATAEGFGDVVRRAGFEHLAAGAVDGGSLEAFRRLRQRAVDGGLSPEDLPQWLIVEYFAKVAAPAMLADRERLLDWRPDLVVREEGEFAGPVIAALAGIPWVDHSWGPMRPPADIDDIVAPLALLWERYGLEPDSRAGFFRWLYLDVAPPTLQFPYAAEVANRRPIRPMSAATSVEVPSWLDTLGQRPCVYVTLGTSLIQANDTDFFQIVMSALQDEDVDVVVTVGPADPTTLGPIPPNARAERFIPQAALLPFCSAMVSNGGAGSTMGALAAGVPLLIVPAIAASQTRNAQAVVRCGAGRSVARTEMDRVLARSEVGHLLDDPSYGRVARTIADEIAAMPEPADLVPVLEALSPRPRSIG
jgi:UDP:flavonoid glycosyltransferase YjiC (YdhE family)